jgi:RNA polymerase sigma-70 factor (ECF subfamily)
MPDEPEAAGLLAPMLFGHSRRAARADENGAPIPLEEQDRSRWDRAEIDEGSSLLERSLHGGEAGPYRLQAMIAACHATATTMERADWAQLARLYAQLREVMPGPVLPRGSAAGTHLTRARLSLAAHRGDGDGAHEF